MKLSNKALLTIFPLIITVYVMRSLDTSFLSFATDSFRQLSSQQTKVVLDKVCGTVDPSHAYTQSEVDNSNKILDSVTQLRGGNPLKDMVLNNQAVTTQLMDYGLGLVKVVAYNPVFFVITILVSIVLCCNCCCMYCGCCKDKFTCCNRCCKEPKQYSGLKKKLYFLLSILLTLGIFSTGIAGAAISSGMGTGISKATCAAVNIFDVVVRGELPNKWAGMNGAYGAIVNLNTQISTISSSLASVSTSFTNMNNALNAALTEVDNLYNTYQASTLPRPDSTKGTYQTIYNANLGPSSTSGTFTYALATEMNLKKTTVQTASTNINSAISTIQSTTASIQSALTTGQTTTQSLIDQVVSVTNQIGDRSDLINTIVGMLNKAVLAIFVAVLMAGASGFGSILLTCLCKKDWSNKISKGLVFTLLTFAFFGFFINTLVFPLSIISVEVCGVLDSMFNDASFMNQTLDLYMNNPDVKNIMYTCTFGDGDLLGQFGVQSQIGLFDTVLNSINQVSGYLPTSSIPIPNSIVIPFQKDLLNKFKSGQTPDSTDVVTDLAKLNAYTNPAASCVSDGWVLNSGDCSTAYPGYNVWVSTNSRTSGVPNTQTCLAFGNQWGTGTGASRYSGRTCAAAASTMVDSFVANRQALNTLADSMISQLDTISTKNDDFMTEIQNLITTPFTDVNNTVSSVYTSLADPNVGLLNNLRCNAVFDTLRNMREVLCVGFVTALYQTAVVMAVISFFSLFGAIFVFCFAKRGTLKEKQIENYHLPVQNTTQY